jgi:hypothetical protein
MPQFSKSQPGAPEQYSNPYPFNSLPQGLSAALFGTAGIQYGCLQKAGMEDTLRQIKGSRPTVERFWV